MKKSIWICVLTLTFALISFSQTDARREVGFVPSKFKARQSGIVYKGKECNPSVPGSKVSSDTAEVIRVGNEIFYEAHMFYVAGRGDGLVIEDTVKHTCTIYPMFAIAEVGGWHSGENPHWPTAGATRGLRRVGDLLWMGSNGVGVTVFDLTSRTWSRHDLKDQAVRGDHVGVDFADKDFVFVTDGEFPDATLHVYSVKRDKWLWLKSVPIRLMRGYGVTTGNVQVGIDHRGFKHAKFFPVDWTMMYPQVSWSAGDDAYRIEKDLGAGKTIFLLPKRELERAFQ